MRRQRLQLLRGLEEILMKGATHNLGGAHPPQIPTSRCTCSITSAAICAALEAAAPEAKPAYAPVEAAPSQEPPRRRSTIREPAPIGASASAAPAAPPPAPVISVTATTEPATPKRGWWGKRLLGDKD
jgi:hypothetical protein